MSFTNYFVSDKEDTNGISQDSIISYTSKPCFFLDYNNIIRKKLEIEYFCKLDSRIMHNWSKDSLDCSYNCNPNLNRGLNQLTSNDCKDSNSIVEVLIQYKKTESYSNQLQHKQVLFEQFIVDSLNRCKPCSLKHRTLIKLVINSGFAHKLIVLNDKKIVKTKDNEILSSNSNFSESYKNFSSGKIINLSDSSRKRNSSKERTLNENINSNIQSKKDTKDNCKCEPIYTCNRFAKIELKNIQSKKIMPSYLLKDSLISNSEYTSAQEYNSSIQSEFRNYSEDPKIAVENELSNLKISDSNKQKKKARLNNNIKILTSKKNINISNKSNKYDPIYYDKRPSVFNNFQPLPTRDCSLNDYIVALSNSNNNVSPNTNNINDTNANTNTNTNTSKRITIRQYIRNVLPTCNCLEKSILRNEPKNPLSNLIDNRLIEKPILFINIDDFFVKFDIPLKINKKYDIYLHKYKLGASIRLDYLEIVKNLNKQYNLICYSNYDSKLIEEVLIRLEIEYYFLLVLDSRFCIELYSGVNTNNVFLIKDLSVFNCIVEYNNKTDDKGSENSFNSLDTINNIDNNPLDKVNYTNLCKSLFKSKILKKNTAIMSLYINNIALEKDSVISESDDFENFFNKHYTLFQVNCDNELNKIDINNNNCLNYEYLNMKSDCDNSKNSYDIINNNNNNYYYYRYSNINIKIKIKLYILDNDIFSTCYNLKESIIINSFRYQYSIQMKYFQFKNHTFSPIYKIYHKY